MEPESQTKVTTSESTKLLSRTNSSVGEVASNLPDDPKKSKNAFYKTVKITNPNEVNRTDLVRQMKERFAQKSKKWEARAANYTRFSFALTFLILMCQIVQMILLPLKNGFIPDKNYTIATSLVAAIAALIAGLQLKLKLHDKVVRIQKGVKIYNRMLRSTSYYLMMTESGGIPADDDTILMWEQALKAEIENVPVIRKMSSF